MRFFMIAFLYSPLIASATDGTQLYSACQDAEQYDSTKRAQNPYGFGLCLGLLEGVNTMMQFRNELLPRASRTCFPEQSFSLAQGVKIVMKYLRDNPEQHHEAAGYLILLAYEKAFPCKS